MAASNVHALRLLVLIGVFGVALAGGVAASELLRDDPPTPAEGGDRAARQPIPVPIIAPVAEGPDAQPPAGVSSPGSVPTDDRGGLSPVVGLGFTSRAAPRGASGDPGGAEPSPGADAPSASEQVLIALEDEHGNDQVTRFVDPCAGAEPDEEPPPVACDEGEAASVVAALRQPPDPWIIPVTEPARNPTYGRRCGELGVQPESAVVDLLTSTPGEYTVEWWPEDTPGEIRTAEVSSSDPDHPEYQRFQAWFEEVEDDEEPPVGERVHHCVRLTHLTGEGRRFVFRAFGIDIFGREVPHRGHYPISVRPDESRPPVEIRRLDATRILVSVPSERNEEVRVIPVPLDGQTTGAQACAEAERADAAQPPRPPTSMSRSNLVVSLSDVVAVVDGEGSPAPPPRFRIWTAMVSLEEGRRHAVCIVWNRITGAGPFEDTVVDREVHLVETENHQRFRLRLVDYELAEEASPGLVGIFLRDPASGAILCGRDLGRPDLPFVHPGESLLNGPSAPAEPVLVCESGGDTGAAPGEVDLVVRKDPNDPALDSHENVVRLRLETDACAPSADQEVRLCGSPVTEWYRVAIPSVEPLDEEACRHLELFGVSCGEPLAMRGEDGSATLRLDYEDGATDTDGFRVGINEPYAGPEAELPPEPQVAQVGSWTARVDKGPEPGSAVVRFFTDRPVKATLRGTYRGNDPDRCGTVPPIADDAFRKVFAVQVDGLCPLSPYAFEIRLVDRDGRRVTYSPSEPAPYHLNLIGASAGHHIRLEATIRPDPEDRLLLGTTVDETAVSIGAIPVAGLGAPSLRFPYGHASCVIPERRTPYEYRGQPSVSTSGEFEVGDTVAVFITGSVTAWPGEDCGADPRIEQNASARTFELSQSSEDILLAELLGGTVTIPFEVPDWDLESAPHVFSLELTATDA